MRSVVIGLTLALVTGISLLLGGCGPKDDASPATTTGGSGTTAAATPMPADVKAQVDATQQADAARRNAHAPPAPK